MIYSLYPLLKVVSGISLHPLYCAYMYHDKKVQKVIMDNYRKVEDRINSEFESKIEWFKVRADKDILQLG
ncbi:hypothetical protein HR47_02255 [Lactiplantibacillus paraplantarum]|nr:hypothetical protein HR47_02255 [Lactiplantibacillus paraplantarum]